jgi:hypothetical protein
LIYPFMRVAQGRDGKEVPGVRHALLLLVLCAGPALARDLVIDDIPLPRPRPFALRALNGAPLPVPRPALPDVWLATAAPPQVRLLPDLIELPQEMSKETSQDTLRDTLRGTSQETFPETREPSACQIRLGGIAAAVPLAPLIGPGDCGALDVVRLDAVLLTDQRRVAVEPPAVLRCEMAEAVARWVREDVVGAAVPLGAPLIGIENFDSYECRSRNRLPGAKTSEHGKANALDVRALKLLGRRAVELTDPTVAHVLRENLRASACARFTTVLGPGSDGYHESHIHLDLAERRGGYRACQWDVRDPAPAMAGIPLPRARPPQAPARAADAEDAEEE